MLQAAQALLFQLGAGLGLFALLGGVAMGFLVFGGASDFLPELPALDPFSAGGLLALALWLFSALGVPVWYVWTLVVALRASRRSAHGEIYAYPLVGRLVWEEAPRIWKWMVIETGDPHDDGAADHGPVREPAREPDVESGA